MYKWMLLKKPECFFFFFHYLNTLLSSVFVLRYAARRGGQGKLPRSSKHQLLGSKKRDVAAKMRKTAPPIRVTKNA